MAKKTLTEKLSEAWDAETDLDEKRRAFAALKEKLETEIREEVGTLEAKAQSLKREIGDHD